MHFLFLNFLQAPSKYIVLHQKLFKNFLLAAIELFLIQQTLIAIFHQLIVVFCHLHLMFFQPFLYGSQQENRNMLFVVF